ncbi:MAG: DPP IV N-terminal domain-containing protein [Planctomycetota bacterium]|jgi:TolB protein
MNIRNFLKAMFVLVALCGCESQEPAADVAMSGHDAVPQESTWGNQNWVNSSVASRYTEGTHQPNPMLAAARASDINLFGEISNGPDSGYHARTSGSLVQHSFTNVGSDLDPHLDSTGQRIAFASTRHNHQPDIYVKSVDGVAVTQLTSDPSADIHPVWSPDDSKIAYCSNRGGNWDIWMIGAEGGQPVQVTSGMAEEVHPSWSPDGSQIVYSSLSANGGPWELWIVDAMASGRRRFIGYGLFPEWSPNGDTIAYQRARERGSRWFSIWTLTLINGEPHFPTEVAASSQHAMINPTWSKDGLKIAFAATRVMPDANQGVGLPSGTFDIWVINADGTGRVRVTDGYTANFAPVFAPDGRVYFTSGRTGRENVWSQLPNSPTLMGVEQGTVTQNGQRRPAEGRNRPTSALSIIKKDQE